jgi:broad specificity phosphatase PhoE
MSIELYLIRHGESEVNLAYSPKEVFLGRNTWSELTERGVKQARDLGRFLKGAEFDRVFSSSTIRAQQTARYCLQEMGYQWPLIEVVSELSEIDHGDIEGKNKREIMTPEVRQGVTNYWRFVPPRGNESQEDVYRRAYSWIERNLLAEEGRFALFTHETVIKCLLVGMFDLDDEVV